MQLSRDPDDDPILATALAGEAEFLVTGDGRDLLALGRVGRVEIVSARCFADVLGVSGAH